MGEVKTRATVTLDINADISSVNNSIKQVKNLLKLGNIEINTNEVKGLVKLIDGLETQLKELDALSSQSLDGLADTKKLQTIQKKISNSIAQIGVEIKGLKTSYNKDNFTELFLDLEQVLKKASAGFKSIEKEVNKNKNSTDKLISNEAKLTKQIEIQEEKLKELRNTQVATDSQRKTARQNTEKAKKAWEAETAALEQYQEELAQAEKAVAAMSEAQKKAIPPKSDGTYNKRSSQYRRSALGKADTVRRKRDKQQVAVNSAAKAYDDAKEIEGNLFTKKQLNKKINDTVADLSKLQASLTQTQKRIQELSAPAKTAFEDIKESIAGIVEDDELKNTIKDLDATTIGVDKLKEIIKNIKSDKFKEFSQNLQDIAPNMEQASAATDRFKQEIDNANNELTEFSRQQQDIENLKNQVLDFFSIVNAVQLFKRTVQSAFNTVKELDAAMTETATVTDFSIGDMWNELPRYTEMANKLGATTLGAYETMTLFYQQGLKTNEAMEIGAETMKMARIAGLDYATATDYMTAALRGFNMELNETSAQRVNDVYSELAAITAADTEEISVAMTKTASIANSANMEFETTAAFLSQIIETTRESAETAGTAMKTIVARFSEVKKLRSEGLTTGTDEEGETVDVNKIQTALRTVGISMDEFFAGTEGLDQVLLRLAEKWDSLDVSTQRYIATTAAGSRQQSRFLAMMQDYDRTMQLVSAANNSAGASQRQFDKTLESLEAKLNKLKNAWDAFALGIANSTVIKVGVDLLTGILTVLNKITDILPGATSGFAKLGLAILAIKAGAKAVDIFSASYKAAFANSGKMTSSVVTGFKDIGKSFTQTMKNIFTKKFWFNKPIKLSLNTEPATKAVQKYQQAQLKLQKTQNLTTKMQQRNTMTTKKQAALNRIAASAQEQETAAINEYALATGLSNIQATNALALTSMGVSQDIAAAAAVGGLTSARMIEIQTTMIANGVSAEERKARMAEIVSIYAGIGAKELENKTDKAGIITKLTSVATTILSKLGIDLESNAKAKNIAMTLAQKFATDQENASKLQSIILDYMKLGVIGLIIAAIIILIALIIALAKAIKNSSDSARMEKLNKSIADMAEEAENAKNKMEEIADARSGLEEMQDSFANLTKGTREWKEALVEINQKVLDLISTYPELAQYVEKGAQGQLTIADEGWDAIYEAQQQKYQNTLAAKAGLTVQKQNLQQEMDFEKQFTEFSDGRAVGRGLINLGTSFIGRDNIYNNKEQNLDDVLTAPMHTIGFGGAIFDAMAGGLFGQQFAFDSAQFLDSGWGKAIQWVADPFGTLADVITGDYGKRQEKAEKAATGGLTQEEYSKFAAAAAEAGVSIAGGSSEEEFKAIYTSLGFDKSYWDSVYSKMEALGTQFDELANSALGVELANEAQKEAIIANAAANNEIISNSEFDSLAQQMVKQQTGDLDNLIDAEADDIDEKDDELKELYAEEVGAYYENGKLYSDSSMEKELDLSDETMKDAIAAARVNKQYSDSMTKIVKELDRLRINMGETSTEFKRLTRILSDEGQNMTTADIQEIAGEDEKFDTSDAEALATEYGYSSADVMATALGYDNLEEFMNVMQANIDMTKQAYETANQKAAEVGLDIKFDDTTIGSEVFSGITSKLADVAKESDIESAQQLSDTIFAMVESFGEDTEAANNFMEALNGIDWSNISSIEELDQVLEELGIDPATINGLDALKQDIIELNNATYTGNLLEFQQKFLTLIQELKNALENGTKELSEESKQALIDAGLATEDDFRAFGDAWIYVGQQSISELLALARKELAQGTLSGTDLSLEQASDNLTIAERDYNAAEKEYNKATENLSPEEREALAAQEKYYTLLNTAKEEAEKAGIDITAISELSASPEAATDLVSSEQYPDELKKILSDVDAAEEDYENKKGALIRTPEEYEKIQLEIDEKLNNYTSKQIDYENKQEQYDTIKKDKTYASTTTAMASKYASDEELYNTAVFESQLNELNQTALDEHAAMMQRNQDISAGMAMAVAKNNALMNQGLGEIIDSYDEWTGLIDKSSGKIKIAGSEDAATFTKLKQSVNKMLNTSEDLSDSFWDNVENMKNIKKAAEGDAEAFEELQKAASADFLENMNLTEMVGTDGVEDAQNAIQDFVNYMDGVEIPKLEAGVKWEGADAQEFINSFNQMAEAANMSSTDIQKAVQAMGFNAEIEYIEQTRKIPKTVTKEIATTDPETGAITKTTTSWVDGYDTVTADFPVVKTLTSTGSGGGGISLRNQNAGAGNKGKGGSGGKGGGGSKTEKWENPYDWLYNLTEDINEQIRIREKLERRYDKILEARKTTANALYENTLKEIEALKKQEELQEEMLSKRQQEMKDYIKKNKSLNKYATYNWSDNTIEINWDKINKVTSTTTGEKIEEYVSKLEELQDAMDEAQDSLYDIEDDLQEVIERGKDEYFELEDLVHEALQQFYQDQIDTMSEVNDTINDTNSKLIDTIQSQVDKIRQDRENEKTEEELADKQRRLIYLQQDTSGANDLEILQLQEELEQGQQDYTDTLIDQKISALQEQNDKAAEQRERQITLAQAQLDYAIQHGQLWQEVYALMDSGINGSNGLIKGSDLERLFKDGEAYTSLSTLGKMEWLEETNDQIALAINYLRIGRQLENLSMTGQKISFTTSDGKKLSGTIAEDGTVTADGHKYEDIYQTESGDFYTDETYVAPKQEEKDEVTTPTSPSTPSSTKPTLKKGATVQVKPGQKWYGNSQGGGGSGRAKSGRIKYINTKGKYPYNIDGKGWIKKSSIVGYKTGGMADFTGPAWLDGTPSKPEYILNAEQTKGFFRLIDVLGGLSKKDSNETSSGDNYFDIDVNVEEIGSDYDVDQIAERIKQLIYTDSMYRNVNAVRIIK